MSATRRDILIGLAAVAGGFWAAEVILCRPSLEYDRGYNAAVEQFYKSEGEIYVEDHATICIIPHPDISIERRCAATQDLWSKIK